MTTSPSSCSQILLTLSQPILMARPRPHGPEWASWPEASASPYSDVKASDASIYPTQFLCRLKLLTCLKVLQNCLVPDMLALYCYCHYYHNISLLAFIKHIESFVVNVHSCLFNETISPWRLHKKSRALITRSRRGQDAFGEHGAKERSISGKYNRKHAPETQKWFHKTFSKTAIGRGNGTAGGDWDVEEEKAE